MKVDMKIVFSITYFIVFAIIVFFLFFFNRRRRVKNYEKNISEIEYEKNIISTSPIASELEKVETIIKNERMEEKYNNWIERYKHLREIRLPDFSDMLIELGLALENKEFARYAIIEAKTELELYKIKNANDSLMKEITDINLSEEKYRTIITKLKAKYRELNNIFNNSKEEYGEFFELIDLQFENIERRFQDFEAFMERNEYDEVVHIVKAIDTMIDHMIVVVDETPNLVLLATKVIPKRIESITKIYEEMIADDYSLDYLNVNYNMEESIKNINLIIDRIKVLNLEDCMFELTTMLSYLDSLFEDFDKEKIARKSYDNNKYLFEEKLAKTNASFDDIYKQLDTIKTNYALRDNELDTLEKVKESLEKLNKNYKNLLKNLAKKKIPYSKASLDLEEYTLNLKELEDDLENSLNTMGTMYDDEQRAREQLGDIVDLLASAKIRKRGFNFPVESSAYAIQLSEAKEASLEVSKELSKQPIDIKILNTRVDTARDLAIKLYSTTTDNIHNASLCEKLLVHANRYRSSYQKVDDGLDAAEQQFIKGNYESSLEIVLNVLELIEKGIKEMYINEIK